MAGIKTTFKVEGLKEMDKKLATLPKRTAAGVLKKALQNAAEILQKEAISHAPVATGKLKNEGIVISPKSKYTNMRGIIAGYIKKGMARSNAVATAKAKYGSEKSFAMLFMGVVKDMTHKAVAQEFGTSQHPAQSFMRPAFDNKKEQALDAMINGIKEPLDKAIKRMEKKKAKL